MGRHRSTIYREIRRNWWHDAEVPAADGYWPVTAQKLAADRRARQRKLARNPELRAAVVDRLISNLEIATHANAIHKVDWYARRSSIETFFKTFKSGGRVEEVRLTGSLRLRRVRAAGAPPGEEV